MRLRRPGIGRALGQALCLALLCASVSAAGAAPPEAIGAARADFGGEAASETARRVADWVVGSGDAGGLPFVIVDKVNAKVFVFAPAGSLRGATRALLGLARGDDTTPGIGQRALAAILPSERTTPAGRFVAALGRDLQQDILWIDYDAALSLHRVIKGAPAEHRARRLATTSSRDKRISYGCINVPGGFYDTVVAPTFRGTRGIVYILPEIRPLRDVFAMSPTSSVSELNVAHPATHGFGVGKFRRDQVAD